eukprot:7675247-Pyramimonas_sp.AAC.1
MCIRDSSREEMKRRGVHVDTRAPRQRARFMERGRAVLRRALHTPEEQLEREGITTSLDYAGVCHFC